MSETRTILVVDDSEGVRTMLKMGLEKQGWKVILADSGLAVVELLSKHNIAAVLLDIVMEGREGIETLMQIRTDYPDMVVIMMSSYADYLELSEELGANASLEKPINLHELHELLEALIPTGQRQRGSAHAQIAQ